MNVRTPIALTVAAGLLNPLAAIISNVEHQTNSEPVLLALFVIPWLVAAFLLYRGKRAAGAIVAGVLALFTLANAPSWQRTSALDWTGQVIAVAMNAAVLVAAVTLLVQHYRTPKPAGAVR